MDDFPKKLREQRRRLGMSQLQLAEVLGLNVQTISKYERRKLDPPRLAFVVIEYLKTLGPIEDKRYRDFGSCPEGKEEKNGE